MWSYQRVLEVMLMALPWVWIAAAAMMAALSRGARQPGLMNAFATALAAYGVTDFFISAEGPPTWWLALLKGLCVAGLYLILFLARGAKNGPSGPSRSNSARPGQ